MGLDKGLLEILACPACKEAVREEGSSLVCENTKCGLRFPIRNGIPVMLIDEAQKAQA